MSRRIAAGAILALGLFSAGAQAKPLGLVPDVSGPRARILTSPNPNNLPYQGGPVLHHNRSHLIFWEPQGSGLQFDPGYVPVLEQFMSDVSAASHSTSNVYGLSGQYTDGFGPAAYDSAYGGAVMATDPLPSNGCVEPPVTGPGWTVCLTDRQLQAEIEHVVAADRLPTTDYDVYFLVTPNGLGDCTDQSSNSCALGGSASGYCGYHSVTSNGEILYAVIPYNAVAGHCQSGNPRPNGSTADPTISSVSHEHNEMVTDPVGDAWIDSGGNEDGDLCITNFGPAIGGTGASAWNEEVAGGHYWLQGEWSNYDGACEARALPDQAWFSVKLRASAGKPTELAGAGSDPHGGIVGYLWRFGDGTTGHGRNVRHVFRRPGDYRVTLRTTDSAGNWTFYTRAIRVSAARERRGTPVRGRSPGPTKSG